MNENITLFLIYSALLFGVMLIADYAYRFLKVKAETSRKIAHVGSGIIALTYPDFIDSHWVVFALSLSFTLVLYGSKKLKLFPSIFDVERRSYGELFFVWTTWFLFLIYQYTGEVIYYYLPFSIVVFADPLAALIGQSFPIKKYRIMGNSKSYGGSFAFFMVAFALSYYFFSKTAVPGDILMLSVFHALLVTLVEAVSTKGTDNITIPFVSVLFIYLVIF
jgi:dolichol kinase